MENKHQTLKSVLNSPHAQLGHLTHKVTEIQRINQYLQTILPESLQEHCFVVNLRDNALILGAANANWLTLLRFHTTDILQRIQRKFQPNHITQIRCIVTPEQGEPNQTKISLTKPYLSSNNAKIIEMNAGMTDDPELKEALLKLAKNGL